MYRWSIQRRNAAVELFIKTGLRLHVAVTDSRFKDVMLLVAVLCCVAVEVASRWISEGL
jgi:hypothetical protein